MKEITHGVERVFDTARSLMMNLLVGLLLVSVLTVFLGELTGLGNGSALAAIVIVIGGEIILRRRKKKKSDQFGDVARGSEVQDHTDK